MTACPYCWAVRRIVLPLVVIGVVAACSPSTPASPSPSSSFVPAAEVPALTAAFTSPLMGYSVMYPTGWTPTAATEAWLPGASNFWDDPVGDRLESATAGFRGTSQPLASGQTPEQWLEEYLAGSPSCGDPEQVPVADEMGTVDLNGCAGQGRLGGRVFDVAVVSGDRGYNFTMEGEVDHAFFLAMLAAVTLEPASAVDSSSPPP